MPRTKKDRTPVPENIAAVVMHDSNRTCCVCQIPGKRLQVHHIDEDPANHDIENLACLCFDCHDQTQIKGGFGRKLDAAQVKTFREEWAGRVRARRAKADELTVEAMVGDAAIQRRPGRSQSLMVDGQVPALPERVSLPAYIHALPEIRRSAYLSAGMLLAGSTVDMIQGMSTIIDVMREALLRLSKYYPDGHFDGDPEAFIDEQVHHLYAWHGYVAATFGHGNSGTITGPTTAARVLDSLEDMVVEMVMMLGPWDDEGLSGFHDWRDRWAAAGPGRGHGDRAPGDDEDPSEV